MKMIKSGEGGRESTFVTKDATVVIELTPMTASVQIIDDDGLLLFCIPRDYSRQLTANGKAV